MEAIKRRRQHQYFPWKRLLIFLVVSLALLIVVKLVMHYFPNLQATLGQQRYISPLANALSIEEAIGSGKTADMVKNDLQKKRILVQSVEEFDGGFRIQLQEGEIVFFSKKKDIDQQISSLQLISSRFTIEGKRFTRLDLRFDRPVIVPK